MDEPRLEFLIENLYVLDKVVAICSHMDRMVTLGYMPVRETLLIDKGTDIWASFDTEFSLERREIGILNIGGTDMIEADGRCFSMGCKDCLYITMGTCSVAFSSEDETNLARFLMVSAPARCAYETASIGVADAVKKPFGSPETANERVVNQFIHPDVLKTCQLSMGLAILEPGSVWSTMPVRTHECRTEIYTHIDIPKDSMVSHFTGSPMETQHLVTQNEQTVISPSWSVHSGCGTSHYSFIWAMGDESQAFDDTDTMDITALK